jgi:two-component system phosphate regulon response regulator PhoB
VETGSREENASKHKIAFSSEVETGSREENASKHKIAFSSEVETGSREENASKHKIAFSSEVETGSREENASKHKRRLKHMSARILVVEDEEALTTLLRYNLDAEGYDVETVGRGDDADTRLKERVPDLIVLDWMLPGLSGIELCRRLRARPETRQLPIIMLTARGEESERVRGLATGADDYIVKPFSVPELLARVKGLLRRASPERLATVLSYGDIELDREKRRVARSGRPIDLGPTEYRLLEFFLEHPGRVFSREQLLDSVWGRDIYIDERTVDVHIGRLRKLLNPGREQDPIRTVRGAGYALDDRFAKVE